MAEYHTLSGFLALQFLNFSFQLLRLPQTEPHARRPKRTRLSQAASGLTSAFSLQPLAFRVSPQFGFDSGAEQLYADSGFKVTLWLKILLLRREAPCRRDPLKLPRCSPKKKPSASICRPSPRQRRRSSCRPWLRVLRRRPLPRPALLLLLPPLLPPLRGLPRPRLRFRQLRRQPHGLPRASRRRSQNIRPGRRPASCRLCWRRNNGIGQRSGHCRCRHRLGISRDRGIPGFLPEGHGKLIQKLD